MDAHMTIESANLLSGVWDKLAGDNILLRKEHLVQLENANPCNQKYHIFGNPEADSIVITYRLYLNIFTYGIANWKIPVTIIGIPCSVSKQGFSMGIKTKNQILEFVRNLKGSKLILNTENVSLDHFAMGKTLPTCQLNIGWNTFEEYLLDMRSHYRYRAGKALKKWNQIQTVELEDNIEFDEELYQLYLQVYEKSDYKLEKLSIDFFKTFPARIIKFQESGNTLGFIQLLENKEELIFLMGGFDYGLNHRYDIYFNMLLKIIRLGIEGGYGTIDMGQTAEDTKMKLGCIRVEKFMYIHHSNRVVNFLVRRFIGLLSYKEKDFKYKVFRR